MNDNRKETLMRKILSYITRLDKLTKLSMR